MARIDVVMPQMGESIAEGTIVKWHKKVGDFVKKDETLLEISTDKVDSEIPSPASGILADIVVKENETVAVRSVIAHLETEAAPAAGAQPKEPAGRVEGRPAKSAREPKVEPAPKPAPPEPEPTLSEAAGQVDGRQAKAAPERPARRAEPAPSPRPEPAPAEAASATAEATLSEPAGRVEGPATPASTVAGPASAPFEGGRAPGGPPAGVPSEGTPPGARPSRFYSPLVLNIARSEGVPLEDLERIPGSGEGGRVTKKDLQNYLESRKTAAAPKARLEGPAPAPAESARPGALQGLHPVDDAALRQKYPAPGHEILQMSNVLQRMAQHMVQSVQTSPHVAAVHEVDMTTIVRHRERHAEAFEKREGFKLTYTPYLVDAVVKALKKFPLVNSSVDGDRIIRKNFINLGIAVASENGLLVPVIKHAEEKNFLGYARAVNDLAARTRAKKLTPDEIQGGTFTITNYGVFGTLFGTPIINQPQVAILGTGAIKKRVAVIDDAIAIRSMAFFTLSFDHRIIDGATGGMFLQEIVNLLESFDASVGI